MTSTNTLFYGDNLTILRDPHHFPDASVDLIYLDPPFNSNRSYNVLFRAGTFRQAPAPPKNATSKAGCCDWPGQDLAAKRGWLPINCLLR